MLIEEGSEGDAVYILAEGTLVVTRSSDDAPGVVELARLGPGALVGEMAIVSCGARSATVRARGPVLVLEANRDALDAAGSNESVAEELVGHCRRRMAETLLAASPMLSPVPSNERPAVLAALTPRPLKTGERLIPQGEEADGLTLVVQGEVEVSRDEDGERTVIASLGPGNVVGEISVVMRRPASADVIVTVDGLALHLSRDAFLPLAKAHPTLLARLYELAVEREEETLSILAAEAVPAEELLI
jgi:cAMP-dependent protein kinase regulator